MFITSFGFLWFVKFYLSRGFEGRSSIAKRAEGGIVHVVGGAVSWHSKHRTDRVKLTVKLSRTGMARRRENIFRACSEGNKDAVSRVISAGIDPRQVRNPNVYEETLLHTASRYVLHVHSSRLNTKYCAGSVAVV